MPRIVRDADVSWEGNLARGTGAITAAAEAADQGCPFSALIRASATVTVDAKLEEGTS